jgi:hypothetical protein
MRPHKMRKYGSVPDEPLAAGWARTTELLLAACDWLPAPSGDGSGEFRDYLAHNELGLALDVLVEVGQALEGPREFWAALDDAAESMGVSPDDTGHGRSVRTVREWLDRSQGGDGDER